MIAIYRGEDTDFAGQEPIQVKINTPFDLTGYTADVLFGSVVKHFDSDEVSTKTLGLSYSAEETAGFFPGKGYASIKVYDTEGRVAILKRFVIDVRFRRYEHEPLGSDDLAELMQAFINIRAAALSIPLISKDDSIDVIKDDLNFLLEAAKKRVEFSPLSASALHKVPNATIVALIECMHRIETLAHEPIDMETKEDIRHLVNNLLTAIGGDGRIDIDDPKHSVKSLLMWAKQVGQILRTQTV